MRWVRRWEGKCEHTIVRSPDKNDDTGVMLTKPATTLIEQIAKDEVGVWLGSI